MATGIICAALIATLPALAQTDDAEDPVGLAFSLIRRAEEAQVPIEALSRYIAELNSALELIEEAERLEGSGDLGGASEALVKSREVSQGISRRVEEVVRSASQSLSMYRTVVAASVPLSALGTAVVLDHLLGRRVAKLFGLRVRRRIGGRGVSEDRL